ncbi:LamG-like jellyroll fold domain-containing protein, partial [Algibacter sp.]|uniref:LamG domain-containing protein n=1 Tax=Algibacter sp. TaxID=1872428 RepID=UPI003C729A50
MKKFLLLKILFVTILLFSNTIYAQDSDGDGIADSTDLDDDNDGIIDALECQNLLVDSGFNNKTGLSNGNNIGVDISPWILGGGSSANIVKVDGAGGYDYGNGGPFEDANPLTGDGEDQYYLDIASGSNDFYQSFIVGFSAELTYGGYFSSRDGFSTGTARLRVFTGSTGSSGTLVADSGTFAVTPIGGDSENTPWLLSEGVVSIPAGTYSFVVSMNDDVNFDEGYASACLDRDGDSQFDYIDIDSDDDGIPDNVEAQPTIGYIAPSALSASITDANGNGLDDNYESSMGGTDLDNLEDTDGDGTPDYLDSDTDNDGTPDIEENGDVDILSGIDSDNDGLDDVFDSILLYLDINDEVTIGDVADLTSSFGDVDSDALLGGDLDYRDFFDVNPPASATIDFDGLDDYLSTSSFIDGLHDVTIMAWVKRGNPTGSDMVIAGEDSGCKLFLKNGWTPSFVIKAAGVAQKTITSPGFLVLNEWHHITGTYTSTTGLLQLYVDGVLVGSQTVSATGAAIENTNSSNANFEVGRLSSNVSNKQYFRGNIDEVRVFNTVLTESQIQQMVYQEIGDNSGMVSGTVIPKDIIDLPTITKISWNNLIGYYPMTDIVNRVTTDYSGNNNSLTLYNITTIQDQTAPMPYVTATVGAWATQSTWLHGDVWDIESISNNKDWSIVRVGSNVTASHAVKTLGLIIDS